MADILDVFSYISSWFFNVGDTSLANKGLFLQRLVELIVADPLIMAAASIFFVGVIVAFFMRVYHSIL